MEQVFSFVGRKITQDEFNQILVAFTQISWFGRIGERWGATVIQEQLKQFDEYAEIKEQVGQTILSKQLINGECIAILGSTIGTMEGRLRYADRLNLSEKQVYFLVGERPLNPTEKQIPKLLDNVRRICGERGLPIPETLDQLTETHGAMFVVDKINKEKAEKGQQTVNINFINTPSYLNFENPAVARPNTEATLRQFLIDTLDKGIKVNNVIFISDGHNVEAQQIAVERVLAENGFKSHEAIVVGEDVATTTKFSAISGSMAGRLFGVCARADYRRSSKLESKSKEDFRNRVLSYTQGGLQQIVK